MDWIAYLVATLFALLGAASVLVVAVGLPGTWALLALALVIELADGLWLEEPRHATFSWWLLGVCVLLALLGEALEFLAGALGHKHGGGSRRGMIMAVVGGVLGGLLGAPFGLVLGAFVGAVLGTFLGAVVGELGEPDVRLRDTLRPATFASAARVLGTLTKLPIAVAVWIALSVAAFVP